MAATNANIEVLSEKVTSTQIQLNEFKNSTATEFNCVRKEIDAVEDKLTSDGGVFERLTDLETKIGVMAYQLRIVDVVELLILSTVVGRLFNLI